MWWRVLGFAMILVALAATVGPVWAIVGTAAFLDGLVQAGKVLGFVAGMLAVWALAAGGLRLLFGEKK